MKFKLLIPALLGAVGLGFLAARKFSKTQFRSEVNALFAAPEPSPERYFSYEQLTGLPDPVQRYFRLVLKEGQPYIRFTRLQHTGQFKTDLQKEWTDITGEQYFTAPEPGFVWQGKTALFTATDKFVKGQGGLKVTLFSAVTVVDASGAKYDQGELLRWLGESAWFPTNLLPSKNLFWTPMDAQTAGLTFVYNEHKLQYTVRFNARGEITAFETLRFMGDKNLEKWVGKFSDYRQLNGVLVPTKAEGAWILQDQEYPYARFTVTSLEYNRPALF